MRNCFFFSEITNALFQNISLNIGIFIEVIRLERRIIRRAAIRLSDAAAVRIKELAILKVKAGYV